LGSRVGRSASAAEADGYFLPLALLSAGQHTIHFSCILAALAAFGVGVDVTYHVTV